MTVQQQNSTAQQQHLHKVLIGFKYLSILSLLFLMICLIIVQVKSWPDVGKSNLIFQFINRTVMILLALLLLCVEFEFKFALKSPFDDQSSWVAQGLLQAWLGCFVLGYDASAVNAAISMTEILFIVPGWLSFIIGLFYIGMGLIGGPGFKVIRKGQFTNPSPENLHQAHSIASSSNSNRPSSVELQQVVQKA